MRGSWGEDDGGSWGTMEIPTLVSSCCVKIFVVLFVPSYSLRARGAFWLSLLAPAWRWYITETVVRIDHEERKMQSESTEAMHLHFV